ncbi:TetR/AcrR family transcriptional regulator [Lacticaseibacillus salsurivasis]|uniref:TetR/AcrR family transcriptional regulator n=1 Tax=Lacticaseibacillus salsurivasis TaxID=3081441 RepID=UPI0030C6A814
MKTKDSEKYAKILAAAKALILRDGAATISTTKVAKAVGMAQSNLYIYFKNKDDLLRQLYVKAQTEVQQDFAKHVTPNADLTTAVHEYIDAMYAFASTHFDTFELLHQIKALPNAEWTHTITDAQNPAQLIQAAIDASILRPVSPAIIMAIIYNAIRQYVLGVQHGDQTDFDEVRELLLNGIMRRD